MLFGDRPGAPFPFIFKIAVSDILLIVFVIWMVMIIITMWCDVMRIGFSTGWLGDPFIGDGFMIGGMERSICC